MTKRNRPLVLVWGMLLAVFAVSAGAVSSKRMFVASTGNDANPYSITLPCRAFAVAITQKSALGYMGGGRHA